MRLLPISLGAFEARDFGGEFHRRDFRAAAGIYCRRRLRPYGFAHADFGTSAMHKIRRRSRAMALAGTLFKEKRAKIFRIADWQVRDSVRLGSKMPVPAELSASLRFRVDGFQRKM